MPAGLGYRFLDGHDPLPALHSLMDRLEARFTWRVQSGRPLPERILRYADGILGLKEVEYLGSPQPGTFKERSCNLIEQILQRIEARRLGGNGRGRCRNGSRTCVAPAWTSSRARMSRGIRRKPWRHDATSTTSSW